jgi:hypothetical protein
MPFVTGPHGCRAQPWPRALRLAATAAPPQQGRWREAGALQRSRHSAHAHDIRQPPEWLFHHRGSFVTKGTRVGTRGAAAQPRAAARERSRARQQAAAVHERARPGHNHPHPTTKDFLPAPPIHPDYSYKLRRRRSSVLGPAARFPPPCALPSGRLEGREWAPAGARAAYPCRAKGGPAARRRRRRSLLLRWLLRWLLLRLLLLLLRLLLRLLLLHEGVGQPVALRLHPLEELAPVPHAVVQLAARPRAGGPPPYEDVLRVQHVGDLRD